MFQVNWFRKAADGSFLWPGFGENSRVLEWMLGRVAGELAAVDSPIGLLPGTAGINTPGINTAGLDIADEALFELFAIDREAWSAEADDTERFFATFDGRVPEPVTRQLDELRARLNSA